MKVKNTSVFLCALAIAPLCVARGRESEVVTEIVGPHFSSLPDGVLIPQAPLPEPEKPFSALDRGFAILNGGRYRDFDHDSRPYLKKDVRNDPWWWDRKSQRPPKSISPKGSSKKRRPNAVRRR